MKDETKEILDITLEYLKRIDETRNIKVLTINETKILLDHITNLQEENEKLKNFKNFYREKFISNFCAKNRAIKYIKENCIDDEFYINLTNKEKHIIQALDILQGEYKDE